MRKHHIFRPRVSDVLESRAVPATLGVVTPTGLVGISVTLPSQVPTGSTQVRTAFAAFDQSYINAVDNILLASPNGLISPSTRTNFNTAIEQSLETLAEQLVLSLGTTTTTTGSTTSAASEQVVAAIVGNGSNSLESQLLGLSIATIESTIPTAVTTSSVSTPTPIVVTAEQSRSTTPVRIVQSVEADTAATSPSSTSSASTSAPDAVRSAFGNFLNDYFRAVQGVLLAPDASGKVAPSAHRAEFDAKVGQAIQALDTRLSTTLARLPATSALGPQIQAAIGGNQAASLKNQLANLATPGNSEAALVRDFTLGSTQAIARALSQISSDVSKALVPAAN